MIVKFISGLLMVITSIFIWNKFFDLKIKIFKLRTILTISISSAIIVLNYFNHLPYLKVGISIIILILTHMFVYNKKLKDCISGSIFTEFIYLVTETLFSIIMLIIFENNVEKLMNNYAGSLIANIFVCLCSYLLCSLKLVINLFKKFDLMIKKINSIIVFSLFVLFLFVYSIYSINVYYGIDASVLLVLSLIVYIISFIFICFFLKAKIDFYKLSNKYNSSLMSLKAFEEVLNNYRVDNHENKNHLLTIRNMSNNKKVITFIDSIMDNKIKDNKSIMSETSVIPSGGLRGLVYSKLLIMDKDTIDYELDVSPSMRIVNFDKYDNDTVLSVCKIVGIFLDNAIEEVNKLDEKYIIIEMYDDENNIIISITNIFDNTKDKNSIYKVGFSTKGDGHGYGLSLVKKLINKNKYLQSHHEITDNEFTQILEIKKP